MPEARCKVGMAVYRQDRAYIYTSNPIPESFVICLEAVLRLVGTAMYS